MFKVQKRDGRVVDYDRQKIVTAINKANLEVAPDQQVDNSVINYICNCIEELPDEIITVENIQDKVEQMLVNNNKYELAKKYIIYRYQRALVRHSKDTDETILTLVRGSNTELNEENSNKNTMLASTQRDYIAGIVSRDITNRILLPEKISKAHEDGVLHFHDEDYYIQPIFNCCLINIKDMLDNGTVMNGKKIDQPNSFRVACTIMTQIIAAVASNQYGGQSVDIRHLGKYLRKSKDRYIKKINNQFGNTIDKETLDKLVNINLQDELESGIQTIQYQINTLFTSNGTWKAGRYKIA